MQEELLLAKYGIADDIIDCDMYDPNERGFWWAVQEKPIDKNKLWNFDNSIVNPKFNRIYLKDYSLYDCQPDLFMMNVVSFNK